MSSIELLRNNASLIGGVIGAEKAYLQDNNIENTFFLNK